MYNRLQPPNRMMARRVVIFLTVVIAVVGAVPSSSTNEKINSIQHSWKAGITELSNKSIEYKKRLCGILDSKPENRLPLKEDAEILESIPASFDARKKWPNCPSIKSIMDQGDCGSCWAIGAATAISDRLCIATNSRVKAKVSVENLLTCCDECGYGCDGGWAAKAWLYLKETGVCTGGAYNSSEGCQPYEIPPDSEDSYTPPCSTSCTNKKYKVPYKKDLHSTKNVYTLPQNVKAIQTEILKHGPVEAVFQVYYDFYDYVSGVYQHNSTDPIGLHDVRILGWGTEGGKPYWLAANSWGTNWGEKGFFKILRGENECQIEELMNGGIIKH